MKHLVFILSLIVLVSCKNESKSEQTETVQNTVEKAEQEVASYASFGEKIEADGAITAKSMAEKYEGMTVGDTVNYKVIAKVKEVCQKKGCWMVLDLEDDDKEVFVKFKDYGFFMPMNIAGKEVIINGQAFVSETPVEQLRHYAEDAGKSEEEIAAITEPEKRYSFVADGVLIKE